MKKSGIDIMASSALDKLSYVGNRGMGALVYEPTSEYAHEIEGAMDLARLSAEAARVLEGKSREILTELMILGGPPGGARPKSLVGIEKNARHPRIIAGIDVLPDEYEHWIIKFKGQDENREAGIVEYIYYLTEKKVGLMMPETRLFKDKDGHQ